MSMCTQAYGDIFVGKYETNKTSKDSKCKAY